MATLCIISRWLTSSTLLTTSHLRNGSVRLLVGDGAEYTVHRSLLHQSLDNLYISAHQRSVDFEGEEDAVGCLLEFLYTGDYNLPGENPTETVSEPHAPEDQQPPPLEPGQAIHPMVLAARTSSLGVWGRPAAIHTDSVQPLVGPLVEDPVSTAQDFHHAQLSKLATRSQEGDDSKQNAEEIVNPFLIHAKVYLLAEKYGFSALASFALQKLRAALKVSELERPEDHISSLVEFIERFYSLPVDHNTQDRGTMLKLREVVLEQAVDRFSVLQANKDFKLLVKGGGDFVEDLLSHLTKIKLTMR